MTTKDAAKILGVTPRRVLALISARRLSASKVGRDWHIAKKAIEKVLVRPPGRPGKT